jgi:hypothetical protein
MVSPTFAVSVEGEKSKSPLTPTRTVNVAALALDDVVALESARVEGLEINARVTVPVAVEVRACVWVIRVVDMVKKKPS